MGNRCTQTPRKILNYIKKNMPNGVYFRRYVDTSDYIKNSGYTYSLGLNTIACISCYPYMMDFYHVMENKHVKGFYISSVKRKIKDTKLPKCCTISPGTLVLWSANLASPQLHIKSVTQVNKWEI